MITKIFYSIVLFPKVKYGTVILDYSIYNILEKWFWTIEVIFKKWSIFSSVFFIHNDFQTQKYMYKSNNWQIIWDDEDLVSSINNLIIIDEARDFNFFKEKIFYDKIPFWTVLTITSKCNLLCNYCFNDYDYSLEKRNLIKWLNLEDYKKVIDKLYDAWTRDIIITWWEPFTSKDLFDILAYIRNKWIFIRVNTNWSLLFDNTLEKLNKDFSLNIMVSMHEFNNKDYYNTNKLWAKNILWLNELKWFEKKFEKKVIQLKKVKNYENLTLDFLTILNTKNILYLEKLYDFVLSNFTLENWHFFRLYSTKVSSWISKELLWLAIKKIYKLNNLYNTNFKIVDSVPFCIINDLKMSSEIIEWELSVHHNVKTIINNDWYIQIMSAFDSNLWSIFDNDILKVWQWEFVQKMLNQWFLPRECFDCKYKDECRWWSRMEANIYNWSYGALDPFTNLNNKKIHEGN